MLQILHGVFFDALKVLVLCTKCNRYCAICADINRAQIILEIVAMKLCTYNEVVHESRNMQVYKSLRRVHVHVVQSNIII